MAFLESLFGSPAKVEKIPSRYTPQQTAFFEKILSSLPAQMQQLSKPVDLSPIIAERKKSYETEGVPSLLQRLAVGQPTAQLQRGSSINTALSGGLQNLEESLAALQAQAKLQDLSRQQGLFGMLSQLGTQPMEEYARTPGRSGLFSELGAPLMQGLGSYIGSGGNPLQGIIGLLSQFGLKTQPESYNEFNQQPNNQSDYDKILPLLYGLISQRRPQ